LLVNLECRCTDVLTEFLQKLEYFPSLLFLTTNHVESLDPAIASRVHLTINYPALDTESRLTIWRNFLDRASPPAALSWEEIELLSKIDLNGRRIKNVVKSAQIMARREQRAVRLNDIKMVMRITEGLLIE
jgi:ATP-dependent 26S proteasome regulatory subunit